MISKPYPLGATVVPGGVNFSVFAKNAALIELLLFNDVEDPKPARIIELSPRLHKTYHYWHVFVPGLKAGQLYGFRARGPFEPKRGLRFDGRKVLLDPYAKAVAVPKGYSREAASFPGDNCKESMKGVVVDIKQFNWEDDQPLRRPFSQTVIYEMHVAGFTRHPSSGLPPEKRGTYAGLIEKIPYLVELGVTAVELLPVFLFDEQDSPAGLTNYWGYSPVSFFAPHMSYSSSQDPLKALDEFRNMVKALHAAGIEVILDVVYNHTTEGNEKGPTLSYRGFGNEIYYILDKQTGDFYNYSGCGNTLNSNHSVIRRLILDSLHYWVTEMHVDGFRFDLASILSRDESGHPLANPPIIWDIESDPKLAGTKLIAEAWDAAGLYQVGSFIGDAWTEWNGQYRDDVRRFLRADQDTVGRFMQRLLGSPDLYGLQDREPERSINFVTCHDGFTLNDVVSYNQKHNEANLQHNRDGFYDDYSWNYGIEGPSENLTIEEMRNRQIKNFLAVLMFSAGVPMLLMGDEARHGQRGNNNAYCQNNEITWFDWQLPSKHQDIFRFVKELIRFRLSLESSKLDHGMNLMQFLQQAQVRWHGIKLNEPDITAESHSVAVTLSSLSRSHVFHFMVNAYWEELVFELPLVPVLKENAFRRVIDTSLPSPDDFIEWAKAPLVEGWTYTVQPRSVVLLIA